MMRILVIACLWVLHVNYYKDRKDIDISSSFWPLFRRDVFK